MSQPESRILLYIVALLVLMGCIKQKATQISLNIKGEFLIKT